MPDGNQLNLPNIELADIEQGWNSLLTTLDRTDFASLQFNVQEKLHGIEKWLTRVRKVRYVMKSFVDVIQAEPALQLWAKKVWLSMLVDTLRLMGVNTPQIPSLESILENDVPQIFGMPYDQIKIETIYDSDGDRLGMEFMRTVNRIKRENQTMAKDGNYLHDFVESLANQNLHLLGILSQGVPTLLQMLTTMNTGLRNQQLTLEERSSLFINQTLFVAAMKVGDEKEGFIAQDTIDQLAETIDREYMQSDPLVEAREVPLIIMFDEMVSAGVTIKAILKGLRAQLNARQAGFGDIALSNTSFYVMGQKWVCIANDDTAFTYQPVGAPTTRPIVVPKT
jgi:hypothetical protein